MNKYIAGIILLILSSSIASAQPQIVWVPISLGGITFFVPLGEVVPDPTPPPTSDPIVDGNLRVCIDSEKAVFGVVNDYDLETLRCHGDGGANSIVDLEGIQSLTSLKLFSFGGNRVSDLTPLQSVFTLENLQTEVFSRINFTNDLNDADFFGLRNLPNLKKLTFGTPTIKTNPLEWLVTAAAFSGGFLSLEEVNVWINDAHGNPDYNDIYQRDVPCSLVAALDALSSDPTINHNSACVFGY